MSLGIFGFVCSSGCALGVAGLVRFGLGRPCTSCGSLGSLGFVWFVQVRLGVAGFIWFLWFVQVRPGGRLLRSVSFRSVVGVVGIVQVRLGVAGFVWVPLVRMDALWGSWVSSGSSGSFACALGLLGSFGFVWIVRVRHVGRWVLFRR